MSVIIAHHWALWEIVVIAGLALILGVWIGARFIMCTEVQDLKDELSWERGDSEEMSEGEE